jgi:hypothetical protein
MRCDDVRALLAAAMIVCAGCSSDSGSDGGDTETASDGSGSEADTRPGPSEDDGAPTSDDGPAPEVTGDPPGDAIYGEDFEGADGSPWPDPWREIGTAVLSSEIVGGRGRLAGQETAVARIALPGFEETDVDIAVTVEFESWTQQGFGFYVRQNGGALLQTSTPGQGYAVYVEGGFERAIGAWREIGGVEEVLANVTEPIGEGLSDGVRYRIRFQCQQMGDVTALRIKLWPESESEPSAWQLEHTDGTPELQNTAGSFAVDLYNYAGTGSIFVDDIEIRPL